MTLLRALSRGSAALGALFALQNLQRPTLPSPFQSFKYESPRKFVTNDVSLLHHSSLNFNSDHRFGIAPSGSPDPSGKENENPSGYTILGEAEVANQAKESDSVIDADMLKDDISKLAKEIREFTNAELKEWSTIIETARGINARGIDVAKLVEEIEELKKARAKLVKELEAKVTDTLFDVAVKTGYSKRPGILGYLKTLVRKSSLAEIDIASLHEQLESSRKHFSYLKPKIEENRNDLRLKLEELRQEVELHRVEKGTSDDHLDLDDMYEQLFWLTVVALCVILLVWYGI